MAAGPKRLSEDYMELLKDIKEKLETMATGLNYAPGWDCTKLDEFSTVESYIQVLKTNTDNLYSYLEENIKNEYPDKTAEEMS